MFSVVFAAQFMITVNVSNFIPHNYLPTTHLRNATLSLVNGRGKLHLCLLLTTYVLHWFEIYVASSIFILLNICIYTIIDA